MALSNLSSKIVGRHKKVVWCVGRRYGLVCEIIFVFFNLSHNIKGMNIFSIDFRDFNCLNDSQKIEETLREPVISNRTPTNETILSSFVGNIKGTTSLLIDGSYPFKMVFLATRMSIFTGDTFPLGYFLVAYMTFLFFYLELLGIVLDNI